MRRNACAQTNEAGVMNYDVIAYESVCRDVKLHDLPTSITVHLATLIMTQRRREKMKWQHWKMGKDEMATLKDEEDEMATLKDEEDEMATLKDGER
ncbi:hypothetical protein M8J77_006952 [Diaphorina citri]|nr:hypothetical protein M8J77_006952 [Diaphorina citri]